MVTADMFDALTRLPNIGVPGGRLRSRRYYGLDFALLLRGKGKACWTCPAERWPSSDRRRWLRRCCRC